MIINILMKSFMVRNFI